MGRDEIREDGVVMIVDRTGQDRTNGKGRDSVYFLLVWEYLKMNNTINTNNKCILYKLYSFIFQMHP